MHLKCYLLVHLLFTYGIFRMPCYYSWLLVIKVFLPVILVKIWYNTHSGDCELIMVCFIHIIHVVSVA